MVTLSIKLHNKDEELLKLIQSYFGCGNIYKGGKDSLVFKIVDIKQIINNVIPHFVKFPNPVGIRKLKRNQIFSCLK